jgi:hypothetical protein
MTHRLHYAANSPCAAHRGLLVRVLARSRGRGPRNWLVETADGTRLTVPRWNVRKP